MSLLNRHVACACVLAGATLCATGGCLAERKVPPPASTRLTTRPFIQGPPRYDPAKAFLALDQIQPLPAKPMSGPERAAGLRDQAAEQLRIGEHLLRDKRYAEAIVALREVRREAPQDSRVNRLLGLACYLEASYARAADYLKDAVLINPDDILCHYLLGRIAATDDRYDEAIASYRTALLCSNASQEKDYVALTHFHLAQVLRAQGYLSAAITEYRGFEALTKDPPASLEQNDELANLLKNQPAFTARRIGETYEQLGKHSQAADALGRAAKAAPHDLDIHIRYAQALAAAGRIEEALSVARRLVARGSGSAETVELLLSVYKAAGRPEAAINALRQIARDNQNDSELALALADVLAKQHKPAEAEATLRELIRRTPQAIDAYWRLSTLLKSQHRWSDAIEALAAAVTVSPAEHVAAAAALVPIAHDDAACSAVLAEAEEFLDATPGDWASRYLLGLLAFSANRLDLAERWYSSSIDLNKTFYASYVSLGNLYLKRHDWDRAIRIGRAAQQAGQEQHTIEWIIARGYDGWDRYDEAIEHYLAAIRLRPIDTRSMMDLAKLLERIGRPLRARKRYQAVLKIDDHNESAREALIRNLIRGNDLDKARQELAELRQLSMNEQILGRCVALVALRDHGNTGAYQKLLRKLLESDSDNAATRYDLAASHFASRQYDDSLAHLQRLLRIQPSHTEARELLAWVFFKRLDYRKAAAIIADLINEHPRRTSWLRLLAELHVLNESYDGATQIIRQLATRDDLKDQRAGFRRDLIDVYELAGRHDEAIRSLEAWLEADPHNGGLQQMILAVLQSSGEYARAIELAEQGWRDRPALAGTRRRFLNALMIDKQLLRAELLALQWVAGEPGNPEVINLLIDVLEKSGKHGDAVELARGEASLSDRSPTPQALLAQSLLRARDYDEAVSVLKVLVRRFPAPRLRAELAKTQVLAGHLREAARYLRALLAQAKLTSERVVLLRVLATCYRRLGQGGVAESQLERILELQPNDPAINNDLGYTWADAGKDLDRAEQMIRLAVAERPRTPAYLDSLGWVLYKRGQFEQAYTWLLKATRTREPIEWMLDPAGPRPDEDPVMLDHLGDTCWRLGRPAEAERYWTRAVEHLEANRQRFVERGDVEAIEKTKTKLQQLGRGETPSVAPVAQRQPTTTTGSAEIRTVRDAGGTAAMGDVP